MMFVNQILYAIMLRDELDAARWHITMKCKRLLLHENRAEMLEIDRKEYR